MWKFYLLSLFVFCAVVQQYYSLPEIVSIGGLFDEDSYEQDLAFAHAVEYMNEYRMLDSTKLEGLGKKVPRDNDFFVSKTVCSFFNTGVIGIFGPTTGGAADYVQSMCDNKEIPHIQTRWDVSHLRDTIMVNLYPYPPVLAHVYVDLVKAWQWKKFTILYETDEGLPHVSELLKMYDPKGHPVSLRQLDINHSGDYRPILTEAKKAGDTHFVLECTIENLDEILRQAQQVGLMSDNHNYIITNLDMHTIDLTPYQFGGSNITGVRIIDPENDIVIKVAEQLHERKRTNDESLEPDNDSRYKFRLQTALIYDAVHLFTSALRELSSSHTVEPKQLYCNSTDNWEHGYSLINYMKMNKLEAGLSGEIKFDHQGFRSDFLLDVVELSIDGLSKIGTWNSTEMKRLNISRPEIKHIGGDDGSLANRSFVVITALTDPYGMLKLASTQLEGNDRYEGFGIDLIDELSKMLGFNYTFRLQEDSVYGGFDKKTGEWTGMIKELMEHRADLAITDFTITSERESGVDFTMPFMNLGISILYKKPMKMPPKLFSFTSPFSVTVWMYLGGAYFFVSVLLFVIGRISPAEWTNPYPCIEEPEYLFNQFSLKNCFWFTMGSLMQQGSEIAPIGIATRMVAGLWWFFTLIMVSSYTANLAAFLTVESTFSPIKNIEDLAKQNVIKYGAKKGGATASFFRDSNYEVYQKVWQYMEDNPEVMTPTNPIGVKRANEENYAFLMESTSIEYTIERFCNLTQVGNLLDNKGYGIAMRKNSTYRNALSAAVLKLQETGRLAVLKNKWWKEKRGGGACHDDAGGDGAAELSLQHVGGVYLVLVLGCILGIFIAFGEMILGVVKRTMVNKNSFKEELVTELKFVAQLKGQTKPNTCAKSLSPTGSSNKSLEENFETGHYGFINPSSRKPSASGASLRPSRL